MPTPNQKQGLLERIQRQSPYHNMAKEGLDSLNAVQRYIRLYVERDRQTSARRRVTDMTFQGVDQDASAIFPGIAGTFGLIRVPNNQTWKCMRVAAFSEANDILYMYRGAPQPQNIVEKIVCGADGFYTDSFSNDLYMAPGATMVLQSSKAFVGFHVNLEIERMIPYMYPVAAHDLQEDEMAQTIHLPGDAGYGTGTDPDAMSESTVEGRHFNPAQEEPADQPDISEQDATAAGSEAEAGQPGVLLPDVSAHLPPKPTQ